MDHKNNHAGGGFLFGLLIGIAITLLFTTKKGRKILKTLTDEGLDRMSGLEDLFDKRMVDEDLDDDEEMGGEYVSPQKIVQPSAPTSISPTPTPTVHEEQPVHASAVSESAFISPVSTDPLSSTSSGRRFFRRTPKRSI